MTYSTEKLSGYKRDLADGKVFRALGKYVAGACISVTGLASIYDIYDGLGIAKLPDAKTVAAIGGAAFLGILIGKLGQEVGQYGIDVSTEAIATLNSTTEPTIEQIEPPYISRSSV